MTDTTRPGPVPPVDAAKLTALGWRDRAGPAAFALVGGAAIFVGGTPYFNLTPANDSPIYNAALAAAFWLLTRWWNRREQMTSYAVAAQALFVAAAAMLMLAIGPFNWLVTGDDDSLQQALQDKLAQFLSVVPVVLLLTLAERQPWSWIYLQKGVTKRWLTFGLGSLVVCGVGVSFVALAGGASAMDLARVAPGVIAFAALNAVMEELWFRGVFLRPLEVGIGPAAALAVTALIFGAAHVGATYVSPAEQLLFAVLVVGLGAILAWATQWGNALWGAMLLHMGLDLIVVVEFT